MRLPGGKIKEPQIDVILFTAGRRLEFHRAASRQGVADLLEEGYGGFVEMPESVAYLRSGRPWVRPRTKAHEASLRARVLVLVCRQGDPAPLTLGLGRERGYRGRTVTADDVLRLKQASERLVMARMVEKGSAVAQHLGLLTAGAVALAILGALSWGGVVLLGMLQKGGI